MKKFLLCMLCLTFILLGASGCSNNPKDELLLNFGDQKTEIESLNNEEASKYLKCFKENSNFTFDEIKEYVTLYDSDVPKTITDIIENLKSTKSKVWSIKNISLQTAEDKKCVRYDLYTNSEDTHMDIVFMYNSNSKDLLAICIDGKVNEFNISGQSAILLYTSIIAEIDDSLKNNISKAIDIVGDALDNLNKPITYNDWVYSFATNDDQLTFMIIPATYK